MDDKHSHLLAFALTVSCFFSIALPHSHSQPSPPLCAEQSYRCNISVSAIIYPFWKHPASQCNGADASSLLSCYHNNEYQNFRVKDIDNTAHTMKVMLTPPVTDVCSHFLNFDYQNFDYWNLSNTLLLYKAPVHKIIIFQNCSRIPNFPSKRKFTCGDFLYYFEEEEMLYGYPPLQDCTGLLFVAAAAPLDGYNDSDDGAVVLEQALNHAFQVNYSIPDGCCRLSDESCWRYDYLVSCDYYCANQNCSLPKGSKSSILFFPCSLCFIRQLRLN